MSKRNLYYCVVLSWDGDWTVSSFGGRTMAEERMYATSGYQRCVLITRDHDTAQARAAAERQRDKPYTVAPAVPEGARIAE